MTAGVAARTTTMRRASPETSPLLRQLKAPRSLPRRRRYGAKALRSTAFQQGHGWSYRGSPDRHSLRGRPHHRRRAMTAGVAAHTTTMRRASPETSPLLRQLKAPRSLPRRRRYGAKALRSTAFQQGHGWSYRGSPDRHSLRGRPHHRQRAMIAGVAPTCERRCFF